jgi:hypothetical protein
MMRSSPRQSGANALYGFFHGRTGRNFQTQVAPDLVYPGRIEWHPAGVDGCDQGPRLLNFRRQGRALLAQAQNAHQEGFALRCHEGGEKLISARDYQQ